MLERIAADFVVIVHFAFILFVIFGGLAAFRWRRVIFIHLPAAAWGMFIEFSGWICPLTPVEQHLRRAAGQAGYQGGFIEHYLTSIIYPAGLTRSQQLAIGVFVLLINAAIYTLLIRRSGKK